MKRVLTFLAIMLLPLSVWAMTPVSDSDLSNVTGQAGVNINANVTMDIEIGTMAWGDSDGIKSVYNPWNVSGAGNTGGYIGMVGFNIYNLSIKARTELADDYNHYNTLMLKPITIDVATSSVANTAEAMAADTTFVRFGLGALQINMSALQFDVSLGGRANTGETAGTDAVTLDQNLGQVSLGGMGIYISPWSYVDIFSAAGCSVDPSDSGVCFAVNVTIDRFTMDYMSWGDKDGFIAGNDSVDNGEYWMDNGTVDQPGYIGLDDFMVNGPIAITGTVRIDINTTSAGIYAQVPAYVQHLVSDYSLGSYMATKMSFLVGLSSAWVSADTANLGMANAALAAYNAAHSTSLTLPAFIAMGGVLGAFTDNIVAWAGDEYATYSTATVPTTVVHISFPTDFVVDVDGSITAAVKLGDVADFTTGATSVSTLGDIYIQGFKMTLHDGSWVDIWAH